MQINEIKYILIQSFKSLDYIKIYYLHKNTKKFKGIPIMNILTTHTSAAISQL